MSPTHTSLKTRIFCYGLFVFLVAASALVKSMLVPGTLFFGLIAYSLPLLLAIMIGAEAALHFLPRRPLAALFGIVGPIVLAFILQSLIRRLILVNDTDPAAAASHPLDHLVSTVEPLLLALLLLWFLNKRPRPSNRAR